MRLWQTISSYLPTTRGSMQAAVNKAREDMRGGEPRRTEKEVDVHDPDQRPGGYSYSVLRSFSTVNEPTRLCINRLKTNLSRLEYDIVPVDEDVQNDAEIAAAREFFSEAGGFGRPGTRIREVLEELTDDLLTCGCVAMYYRPTKGAQLGMADVAPLASIEPIDAATIIPKRDDKGWIPQPPDVAYVQKLRTDGKQKRFTTDELGYWIWGARTNSSYGMSFVECAMSSVLQYQATDIYNLVWYTEGDNVVGYWHYTGAGEVTPQEVETFRKWLKREKAKAQAKGKSAADLTPPAGWKYEPFRSRSEADYINTQKFLLQKISAFFGLTATALGMETDTYKSSQKAMMEAAIREAVTPIATFFNDIFTAILQGPLGLPSVKFRFDTDLIDQERVARVLKQAGPMFVTINEGREMMGLPRVSGGYADDMFAMSQGGSPVLIASTDAARAQQITEQQEWQQEQGEQQAQAPQADADNGDDDGGAGKAAVVADLRRWRDKAKKAVRKGDTAQVRFVSSAIPAAMSAEIDAALAGGADPSNLFAAKIADARGHNDTLTSWADELGAGLDGLISTLQER